MSATPRTIPATAPLRGVVIVVAGLNNRPDVLDPLATELAAHGFVSLVVTLQGHDLCEQEWPAVDYLPLWQANLDTAIASAGSTYPTLPKFGLGFSLGGTLLLDAIDRHQHSPFAGVALLAPAVTLTTRAGLLRPLLPLAPLGIELPSRTPPRFRGHDSTSLRAYRALCAASKLVRTRGVSVVKVPTAVFAATKDELVDFENLRSWCESESVRFEALSLSEPPAHGYYHLLFDRPNVGEQAWKKLVGGILALFDELASS